MTANVLHAMDNPISQSIAAWPPLALLLTVELISRVPVHNWKLAIARIAATTVIAGIAAWVSYWHMVGVALRYGETASAAHMIPFSVDGLIVVASICLVDLSGRIQAAAKADELEHQDEPAWVVDERDTVEKIAPWIEPYRVAAQVESGSPQADEPAAQPARQDPRTAQEIETAVRAIWQANPGLSQRKIAAAAGTSPTNAGRIIREAKAAAAAQATRPNSEPEDAPPVDATVPEDDREPELAAAQ
ncbi:DUF2637 domain-containing protein [Actinoplanes sp. Pm04-4]|uniref:DUF2637 domain-containing protein n=1 Tax=Paractinoplanes pyxinae TaxID=2997416 RepID=A0ABT4B4G5_9ACTN|nr:DUF2637 domain-containing protein [Actinoplanes pyxinae]MCY1141399.1 DUF2637 domain-containing protein [Actinoplanes pyxinae]